MITFTSAASAYIKAMIVKENGIGFRLTIKKTGCSGYSYLPSIIAEENINDIIIQREDIKIFIDALWAHMFDGIIVDYVEEEKAGLKKKKLIFNNPKESGRCGCGESFHIE
ncbi:MAG TPA: iron-sulfur cluster assembly accessory protein [Gammaproteobacteria bacterium]|nr:iron-sulfur cluster assembly accessory protein [Gammaproteobacteria bacterium]